MRVNQQQVLEQYKAEFLTLLAANCNLYKLLGMGSSESPMWFQFNFARNGFMRFANSQRQAINFEIPLKEGHELLEYSDFNEAYQYFRDLKYTYLKEHEPVLYREIKG